MHASTYGESIDIGPGLRGGYTCTEGFSCHIKWLDLHIARLRAKSRTDRDGAVAGKDTRCTTLVLVPHDRESRLGRNRFEDPYTSIETRIAPLLRRNPIDL